jgi:hypothetical protein
MQRGGSGAEQRGHLSHMDAGRVIELGRATSAVLVRAP